MAKIPSPFDLSGRHALVTGGSRGIGRGIAEALAAAGASVSLLGRTKETLHAAVASLPGSGHGWVQGDAGELDSIAGFVEEAIQARGPLDILVNNAGIIRRGPAEELSIADFDEVLRVNVTAAFAFAQAFARRRLEAGSGGKIINIASLMSEVSRRNTSAYTTSKGAIKMLTKNLACEWAQFGITANAIGPGYIQTDFTEPLQQNPEFDAWVKQRTPIGRWGRPSDIGPVAVFLASAASDFVTGQVIYVDGGILAAL